MRVIRFPRQYSGFSLTELAVVLLIVALLVGTLAPTVSSQIENRNIAETRRTLEDIREALLGFAATTGRLPCPAAGTSGQEAPASGGTCTNFYQDGYIPGSTLGIAPLDEKGFAVDAWGRRIRYAVISATINDPSGNPVANPFTTANGIRSATLPQIAGASPLLLICDPSNGGSVTATSCGTAQKLTDNAVAVFFSTGKNGNIGTLGADEAENMDNDAVFISHVPAPSGAANGEFDDIASWLSPHVLYSRMISAGQLP
jgi:type II secretory pathway pseudopilin PulG